MTRKKTPAPQVGWVKGRDGRIRPDRRVDTGPRDELIRALRAEGQSVRMIAEQADCSVGTVHRVIRQGENR